MRRSAAGSLALDQAAPYLGMSKEEANARNDEASPARSKASYRWRTGL